MSACSRFHSEQARFFRDAKFSDFVVVAGIMEFKCHRIVLASGSKFFDQYFTESPKSPSVNSPVDKAMTEILLRFIYSSSLPTIDAQNVHALLCASELLTIIDVSHHCYEYLRRNVGQLPIRHFESFSFWYNADPLHVNLLRDFILGHFEICLRTDDSFLQLPGRHLKYILEHYRSKWIPYECENFMVVAFIRWARAEKGRRGDFGELLDKVDFSRRVSTAWLNCLRTTYAKDWDLERRGWKAMLVKCLPLFDLAAICNDVTAPAPLIPAPLIPCRTPTQPKKINCTLGLLVGHHAELENPEQCQHDPFETYEIFSKVAHTWPLSSKFVRSSRTSRTCTPALMASTVLDDKLYCLEYDRKHDWPQFSAYDILGDLSTGSGRKGLARVPYPFSHRPSMSGNRNRHDAIYLLGNDELVGSSSYELARRHRSDFDDEKAYKQCCFSYTLHLDMWFVAPFRKHELQSSCLVAGDYLTYLIGGHQRAPVGGSLGSDDAGRYVQAYEDRMPSWVELPMTTHSYHSSRYRNSNYATGCCLNGEIFVCDLVHTEVYSTQAGKWREIPQAQPRMLVKPDAWRKIIACEEDKLLVRLYQTNSNIVREAYDPVRESWDVSTLNVNVLGGSYVNDIFFFPKNQ